MGCNAEQFVSIGVPEPSTSLTGILRVASGATRSRSGERSTMTFIRAARRGVVPTMAAMAAAATFSLMTPAMAAPASPALSNSAAQAQTVPGFNSQSSFVQLAQYRGRHWRRGGRHWGGHRYGRRWRGPGVAGVIAGAIIGGSIIASQRGYRDAWDRCAATYRSFSWNDGTFQPYGDVPRQLCPYLAP